MSPSRISICDLLSWQWAAGYDPGICLPFSGFCEMGSNSSWLNSVCSQCVPVADLGKTVQAFAPAPTMAPATPSTGPVSATQAGSAVTALSVSLVGEHPIHFLCLRTEWWVIWSAKNMWPWTSIKSIIVLKLRYLYNGHQNLPINWCGSLGKA